MQDKPKFPPFPTTSISTAFNAPYWRNPLPKKSSSFNLYRKIKQLKDIVEMDPDNTRIDKAIRLSNIYKMLILLVHHLER